MAEILLSTAGEALLSFVFDKLLEKLNYSKSLDLSENVHNKLHDWISLLPKLQALLNDAEERLIFNPNSSRPLKEWLAEIKNLAYDIEDILDEFEVDAMRSKLTNHPMPCQASTSKFIPACFSCLNAKESRFISDPQTISKVDGITARLERMERESNTLGLISSKSQGGYRSTTGGRLATTSLPEPHVYGRENDASFILQKLLDNEDSSKGFSIVPILGMGGIGKTTLARLVYNEVKPESFELKVWVCVSDNFDVPGITKTILEEVGGKCESNSLNVLQQELNNRLANKKFFLVLDDVWNESFLLWDSLCKPFLLGAAGSKVIVTSRNERVAEIMGGKDRVHHLQKLEDDQCLSILAQIALGKEDFNHHPCLKAVGEKLVKKCKGLPLVAKTLGGLLCGKSDCPDEWEHILNSQIWELPEEENGILPALRLSYLYLPSYLKPCFAFCAMFPKDHEFDKNKLVLLWMAGGVLQEQSEEAGHRCFSELVSRSFFQQVNGNNRSWYVMHDLIHDLAEFVAGGMCFDLERMLEAERKSRVDLKEVRHLSLGQRTGDIFKAIGVLNEMKSLRTFFPFSSLFSSPDGHLYFASDLPDKVAHGNWLPILKSLRIFSIEGYRIRDLPDSIGHSQSLRHLNLCSTNIVSLPESVGFLLKLQTLLLRHCKKLKRLPETIENLIDLQHLDIWGTDSLEEIPLGICGLQNLVCMSKFIVGKTDGSMRLFHLKNFLKLRGELSIHDLRNIVDVEDAREANLGKICGLDKLALTWTSDFSESRDESNIDLQVLNWLRPHPKLQNLKIVSYGGKELSSWVSDASFSNVSSLELRNCKRCTSLPSSLGLLPALKKLIIVKMNAIKAVDHEFFGLNGTFPSLEKLVFEDMPNWEVWTCPTGSGGAVEVFPRLNELKLENCPELIGELPSHLTCLVDLGIGKCPKLSYCNFTSQKSVQNLYISRCNLPTMFDLTSITRLKELRIEGCSSLRSFQGGNIPTTLKSLSIMECENLESLPDGVLMRQGGGHDNVSSLESLYIRNLPLLTSFGSGQLPASLMSFNVYSCDKLESFPDGMFQQCTSLNSIFIWTYGNFKSLPSFDSLNNLSRLWIHGANSLESLPEFGSSIPNLQFLSIHTCRNLKSLPSTMSSVTSITTLCLEDCPGIECIPDGSLPPNLLELHLIGCNNLKSLPDTMGSVISITMLWLTNCPGIECIPDGSLPPNLLHLLIRGCNNLKSLPDTMFLLTSLKKLDIDDGSLVVGWRNFKSLTSLQEITISEERFLVLYMVSKLLPSSVTSIEIGDSSNRKSIPKGFFQNLNCLQELRIRRCPELKSLPKKAMPPSLEVLKIYHCPLLKRKMCNDGGDRLRVTLNVPFVYMDYVQVSR